MGGHNRQGPVEKGSGNRVFVREEASLVLLDGGRGQLGASLVLPAAFSKNVGNVSLEIHEQLQKETDESGIGAVDG